MPYGLPSVHVTVKQMLPQHRVLTQCLPEVACPGNFTQGSRIQVGKYVKLQVDLKFRCYTVKSWCNQLWVKTGGKLFSKIEKTLVYCIYMQYFSRIILEEYSKII